MAIKVIHPELAHDETFRSRFRREVAAARQVSGTYTAPVVAAGLDGRGNSGRRPSPGWSARTRRP